MDRLRTAASSPDSSHVDASGNWTFSGSYDPKDVVFLLKPCRIEHTGVAEKEALIQSGRRHYSEMLSVEQVPDDRYLRLYEDALTANAGRLRHDIDQLARQIQARPKTSETCVILSLARAGTPIGILLKNALTRIGVATAHYSISIIRGRGIDENALAYVAARHGTANAIFVDGWTGKGAIRGELDRSLQNSSFEPFLVVVADPAGRADLAATFDDYVIPSGLLNGIVSGLVSRSILNPQLVGPADFHACSYMSEYGASDVSRDFIASVEQAAVRHPPSAPWTRSEIERTRHDAEAVVRSIAEDCRVRDLNRIKPGIAEATRAILRRVPDRVYVRQRSDPDVAHICLLAERAGVPVAEKRTGTYRAITIIKNLGGEQQ